MLLALPDIREVKARHYGQKMSTFIPTFVCHISIPMFRFLFCKLYIK